MNIRAIADTAEVRACTPDDIPAVAGLFQRTFRDARVAAPASLASYLRDLYFAHPWRDPDLTSKVFVADGTVRGFIGILPLRLAFRGATLRGAVAGSLMVEKPQENPLAGARLLRAYLSGPQDVSLSDSANAVSRGMWERLGGKTMPTESMEWVRAFRPLSTALALAGDSAPLLRFARPLAAAADRVAGLIDHDLMRFTPAETAAREVEASEAELVHLIPELSATYAVRPAWDAAALQWILAHAADKNRHGPMIRRIVRGKDGRPLGCYVYYARRGGVAWVLQLLARPDAIAPVLDNLFASTFALGCVAVRGRSQARLLDALQRRHCLFFHRSATVVHSHDAELVAAIRGGDALVTGLTGDAWTRLIGDTFT
ncbi:MAG TPA: hypothetical protein VK456_13080 [Xanthobacteraceae bacterium]|nr:hypothetical protein [Xanthobacteraceae bacterium]